MPQHQFHTALSSPVEAPVRGAAASGISPNDLAELCEQNLGQQRDRLPVQRPIQLTAISLDGTLDIGRRVSGASCELSSRGIAVDVPSGSYHVAQTWLIGMHLPKSGVRYAGGIVQRVVPLTNGSTRLGLEFGGPAVEILATESLMPEFNSGALGFLLPNAPSIYDNWIKAGVMTKTLLDRVLVCPKCSALPTFRNACQQCGSGRVTTDRLIHHFACAYVGFMEEFETGTNELVCPKCRLRKLVVGSDFEYMRGQYRCQSCGWRESEVEIYCHCLRCSKRFEIGQAREQELNRYDVRRLDPLAVRAELA